MLWVNVSIARASSVETIWVRHRSSGSSVYSMFVGAAIRRVYCYGVVIGCVAHWSCWYIIRDPLVLRVNGPLKASSVETMKFK